MLVLATSALHPLSGTFKTIPIPYSNTSLAPPPVPDLPMVLTLVLPRILALHDTLTSVLLVSPLLLVSLLLLVSPSLPIFASLLPVLPRFLPPCIGLIKRQRRFLGTTNQPSFM